MGLVPTSTLLYYLCAQPPRCALLWVIGAKQRRLLSAPGMFDVTSFGAQYALGSVADWGQSSYVQEPMPNGANNKSPAAKKATAEKGGDLSAKLAKKKSQEFGDKVAGWKQAGGGVAQAHDEVVVIVEEEGKRTNKALPEGVEVIEDDGQTEIPEDATPVKIKSAVGGVKAAHNAANARKTSKEVDLERKAWVRRKSKPQNELDPELKEATTPKKRVVSDGHWRRDRITPVQTPEKEETPKPYTVRRSVVNVGLKVPPAVQSWVEDLDPEPYKRRPVRSRSRSRSADRREGTPDYETSGTKVYIRRRERAKTASDNAKSSEGSNFTAGSSIDKNSFSSSTDITTPSTPAAKEATRPSTAPRERTSRHTTPKDKDSPDTKPRRSPRPAEDGIRPAGHQRTKTPVHEETKRSSPKPETKPSAPPAAPRVFGTRIEGWLNSTSDPFVEPSLAPKPLSVKQRSSKKHLDDISDVTTETEEGHRRSSHQRRSKPSLDPIDIEHAESRRPSGRSARSTTPETDLSGASTPTLKRRGARRTNTSPVKGRSPRSSPDLIEVITEDSSSVAPNDRRPSRRAAEKKFAGVRQLSTIASMDTITTSTEHHDFAYDADTVSRLSDGDAPSASGSLKRRLTKHSDLISVLSMPRGQSKRITSARSIRTQRARAGTATIGDVMAEVTMDELKYQRELRTLVDGVIPVLLQNVLSANRTAAGQRVFSGSAIDNPNVTQPIVDMGIALERLKAAHRRIPMHDPEDLLRWARNTSKVYGDYLQAWRLGFQDIVVNLAPAEEMNNEGKTKEWATEPSRKDTDEAVKGDGERVDVAYLLKRPLVRLKYLAKSFKGVNQITPSPSANEMAEKYHDMVQEARKRANEERARLEDEAAAAIDPTCARDPRSLAPIAGVRIDPTRCVKARDYFDLDLRHSTGQQLTCKIEIIIRDDAPGRGNATDLLFCEVSTTGRWLLFPPMLSSMVSVRAGKQDGEMVLMARGFQANGKEWREVMSLQSNDEGAVDEWLDMLPASPVPPSLMKKSSFDMLKTPVMSGAIPASPASPSHSPREVQIPIGERARSSANVWDGSDVNSVVGGDEDAVSTVPSLRRMKAKRYRTTPSSPLARDSSRALDEEYAWEKSNPKERPESMYSSNYGDRPRTMHSASYGARPKTARTDTSYTGTTTSSYSSYSSYSGYSTPKKEYSVWMPSSQVNSDDSDSASDDDRPPPRRPSMHRRTSSVPSMDMPTVNKLRKSSQPERPGAHHRSESTPTISSYEPSSAPPKLQKRKSTPPKAAEKAPQTPSTGKSSTLGLKTSILPSFTPNFLKRHRRSSSPLKHEYEPSTASESPSESDLSDLEDDESVTSESSAGEHDEQVSTLGELKPFPTYGGYKPMAQRTPPDSVFSPTDPSVAPSQSASQGPYRATPVYDSNATKTVASIFAWADSGSWDPLHPDECCIVVTPGLIEAFDVAQAAQAARAPNADPNQSPTTQGVKPLVALELTPLVPLRRGTALDISIRSPPTANSLYKPGANVMFRSASGEECESLYQLINRARINNPTYIALQNARGPMQTSNWGEAMDRRNAARTSSGFFGLGSRKNSTYRSKGSRRMSTAGTESSVGTLNSVTSALRRFSGSNKIFNIAKSTITSREGPGTRSTYSDSLSSGAATPLPIDPRLGTPLGLTNMKIRLYTRETASKWRDMGSARLTVMLPPRPDPEAPADPRTTGKEKRIIINGKTKGEVLLDATLGESCFERVARTGIAVSVWEEDVGPDGEVMVKAVGGVVGARARVYMVQMKSVSHAVFARRSVPSVANIVRRSAILLIPLVWLASYDTNTPGRTCGLSLRVGWIFCRGLAIGVGSASSAFVTIDAVGEHHEAVDTKARRFPCTLGRGVVQISTDVYINTSQRTYQLSPSPPRQPPQQSASHRPQHQTPSPSSPPASYTQSPPSPHPPSKSSPPNAPSPPPQYPYPAPGSNLQASQSYTLTPSSHSP